MLDFVIVGPQRTGSTWLDVALRTHPDLCLPHGIKETMYYDRRFEMGRERYARYFAPCAAGRLRGEVSPSYFHSQPAAERLHADAPDAKIVIVLRDPAEKTFSLFLHHSAKGRVPRDLSAAIAAMPELVASARYAKLVPMWQDRFGTSNVHLIAFHDIAQRPSAVLGGICRFLGVPILEVPEPARSRVNAARAPRFPWLARIAARSVTALHDAGLHRVVEVGKRLGLKRVYSGGEAAMPKLGPDDRAMLDAIFAEDRAFVQRALAERDGGTS